LLFRVLKPSVLIFPFPTHRFQHLMENNTNTNFRCQVFFKKIITASGNDFLASKEVGLKHFLECISRSVSACDKTADDEGYYLIDVYNFYSGLFKRTVHSPSVHSFVHCVSFYSFFPYRIWRPPAILNSSFQVFTCK